MSDEVVYLFRGTTPGWPGSEAIQEAGVTPSTFDPLVATLFAVECRNYGPSNIYVVRMADVRDRIGPPNVFAHLECEVVLLLPPLEYFQMVCGVIEVDSSLQILADMGFSPLPPRINGPDALRFELVETQANSFRLNLEQIAEYARRAFGG